MLLFILQSEQKFEKIAENALRSQQKRVFAEIKQNENNRVGRVEEDKQKIIYKFRWCERSTRTCLSLSKKKNVVHVFIFVFPPPKKKVFIFIQKNEVHVKNKQPRSE